MATDFTKLMPYEILRYEFDGEPQSFLFQLRVNMVWDKVAFYRLTQAMYQVAEDFETSDNLPKWIAQCFWYVEDFTKTWTTHENFPAPEEDYHTYALETLNTLSYYLFVGEKVEIDFDGLK